MEAQDFVMQLRDAGLTQQQIADRTGIPQPTISKVMRGEVRDVLSRNYRALQALHAEVTAAPTSPVLPSDDTQEAQHAA